MGVDVQRPEEGRMTMIKDFESRVQMHLQFMVKHELVPVAETEKIKAYYLREPGTRIMSVLLLFTPEGIAIQGDFTPEHHGSVSSIGYGLDWFSGELGPGYLCEKFLTTRWVRELCAERLRTDEYWRESAPADLIDGLANDIDDGEIGYEGVYERLDEIGIDVSDGIPGTSYEPTEAAVLVAIHRKFAELWAKRGD